MAFSVGTANPAEAHNTYENLTRKKKLNSTQLLSYASYLRHEVMD